MLSTLLVPLDGSPLPERALPYATQLARMAKGRLLLLHVATPLGWGSNRKPVRDLTAQLEAAATPAREAGVTVETCVYNGYFTEVGIVVAEAAREKQADLIVMSTHGRSGLGRFLYGSVADQALRHAEVPVLLVPPDCERPWPSDRPLHILVPLDGSELGEAALGPAVALGELPGVELILLHVTEPPVYDLQPDTYLKKAADTLRAAGKNVAVRTELGVPATAIAQIAHEQRADLIVMSTHGRSGLARLVLGSVATGTLQRSGVPLLLVRPVAMRPSVAATAQLQEHATAGGPTGPSASMTLTARELDLLERGLGWLMYVPEGDRLLARPARDLLARLEQARASIGQEAAEGTPP